MSKIDCQDTLGLEKKNKNLPVTLPAPDELSSYNITATFNPADHEVTGWVNASYLNDASVPIETIYFHLWLNAAGYEGMTVYDVLDGNGTPLFHQVHDAVNLEIQPVQAVLPGYRQDINIHFMTTLINQPDRSGYITSPYTIHSFGNWHPVLSVFENGSWNQNPYANHGEAFYTIMAYYDVTIVAPENEVLAASGDLIGVTQSAGLKTHHWTAGPVRDFTWVASPDYHVSSISHEGVSINSYYFPEDNLRGLQALDVTTRSLDLFSELFELWPYRSMSVVELYVWFGGMEYCQLVMISHSYYNVSLTSIESFESVLSHEWSHAWNTYIAGNNPWIEPWLDESWAMYSSILYVERYHGTEAARSAVREHKSDYFAYISSNADEPLITGMEHWETTKSYWQIIYLKGELVIDLLRHVTGEEKFFTSVEAYYDEFAYKTGVTTVDIIRVFEETCNMELDWFFDQYVYSAGHPSYSITSATYSVNSSGNGWVASITVKQETSTARTTMPVPFSIHFYDSVKGHHQTDFVILVNHSIQDIQISVPALYGKPFSVNLDPEWLLLREFSLVSKEFSLESPGMSSSNGISSEITVPGFALFFIGTGMTILFWWKKQRKRPTN
ncbi:MAG: M1 family metallopeptidase [Candidatus Odinarchaeota archaeon]